MSFPAHKRRFTAAQVMEMRDHYRAGTTTVALAERYGTSKDTMRKIVTGTLYADVSGALTIAERRSMRRQGSRPRQVVNGGAWGNRFWEPEA